jgi:hypothetical protein
LSRPGEVGTARRIDLGQFPVLAVVAALGILLCAVANALSRETLGPSPLLLWAGVALIAVPIFYRLGSAGASDRERLALVILLGLSLYAVKVVRDSLLFSFPDEFVHAFNAEQIGLHHHLYHSNPALPVTPRYPGLEGSASALMQLAGIHSFAAGIILIGAARATFMAALFLLFARLSGSARTAGLGVAIYTGTSNFVYWGAQFSYESLALPLLAVVLMCFVEREAGGAKERRAWAVPILLGILAVPVTHHLTSYAMAIVFILLAVLYRVMRYDRPNPWRFALLASAAAIAWLLISARSTVSYLFPVLKSAFEDVFKTASGEAAPRTLFHSSAGTLGTTPLPARAVALLAVAIIGVAFLFGIREVWRHQRRQPMVIVFAIFSVLFFGALALRFAPAAWETGNRAGEFLFLGLAFVAAPAAVLLVRPGRRVNLRRLLLAAALGVVLIGGAISGWPWDIQLARPLRVTAEGNEINSQPVAVAEWSRQHLDGRRFAAPEADARTLLQPGGQIAFAGKSPDIQDIVATPKLEDWQLPLLQENHLPFVVAHRRRSASDTLRGFYFGVPGEEGEELLPKGVVAKFGEIPVARIWDSGDISIFDLENGP